MKTLLRIGALIACLLGGYTCVFADALAKSDGTPVALPKYVEVETTQDLSDLGIPCKIKPGTEQPKDFTGPIQENTPASPDTRVYTCTVEGGSTTAILAIMRGVIKYATYLIALVGVLMLVVSGIQYSVSGFDESQKTAAKERLVQISVGLTFLFFIGVFLNSVAPWIYK